MYSAGTASGIGVPPAQGVDTGHGGEMLAPYRRPRSAGVPSRLSPLTQQVLPGPQKGARGGIVFRPRRARPPGPAGTRPPSGVLLGQATGVGQHQLDAVLLVDLGGAGVVVDGHDIAPGVVVLELADHALAHDVVGQAAEGLGADDVGHAGVDELQHLGGEEPALAHLVAVAQVALDVAVELVEVAGGPEAVGALEGVDEGVLVLLHIASKKRQTACLIHLPP